MTKRHVFSTRRMGYTYDGFSEDGGAIGGGMKQYLNGIRVYWGSNRPLGVFRPVSGTERDVVESGEVVDRVRDYEEIDPTSEEAPAWVRERFAMRDD